MKIASLIFIALWGLAMLALLRSVSNHAEIMNDSKEEK